MLMGVKYETNYLTVFFLLFVFYQALILLSSCVFFKSFYCISTKIVMMLSKMKQSSQAAKSAKSNPLFLSFSNIRDLRGNFTRWSFSSFYCNTKKPTFLPSQNPNLILQFSSDVSVTNYVSHRLDLASRHGLIVCAQESLAITRLQSLESTSSQFMALRVCLPRSTHILFFVYRSPASNSDVFATLSDSIDAALHMFLLP